MSRARFSVTESHKAIARAGGLMSIMISRDSFSQRMVRDAAADIRAADEVMQTLVREMDEKLGKPAPVPASPPVEAPPTRKRVRRVK